MTQKIIDGDRYTEVYVKADPNDPVPVSASSFYDLGNSTTTNLGAGATFTGTGIEASPAYGTVSVCLVSDKGSAALGLKFQASIDNVAWETIEEYNYIAGSGIQSYSFAPSGRYFRVVYTNGGDATTKFVIFTVLRTGYTKSSSHRIGDVINAEQDAELVKAVLAAMKPDGVFTDIHCTAGGNLKVSVEETEAALPTVTGLEIPAHDYIDLSYTGPNLTGVVYKEGGSGGTTVATLALSYDGSNNLISVAKS